MEVNPTISFEPDQGISKTQVQQKFDQLSPEMQEVFDNMAAVLVNNPNSTLDVVGSASDIPSNVGGKEKETTVENNLIVAKKRAEAGKEFILQYIKDNYKVEIKPERINTSSAGIGNSEDKKKDQTIKFEIKQ